MKNDQNSRINDGLNVQIDLPSISKHHLKNHKLNERNNLIRINRVGKESLATVLQRLGSRWMGDIGRSRPEEAEF